IARGAPGDGGEESPRGLVGGVAQGGAEEFEDVGLVAQPFAGGKRGALFLARGIRQAGWAHRTFACDRCLKRRDFSGEFNPLLAATGRRRSEEHTSALTT